MMCSKITLNLCIFRNINYKVMKTNIVKQNNKKLDFEIKSLDKQKIVKCVSTTHVGWGFGFRDALLSSLVVFLLLFFR